MADGWFGETLLGGSANQITVGRNADGRLELFFRGTDNYLYRNRQTSPGSSTWEGAKPFPGDRAKWVEVARHANGELELFYVGENGDLYHNRQTAPNSDTWTGETRLSVQTGPENRPIGVSVYPNADGRLELFLLSHYNVNAVAVSHFWQAAPNSTEWLGQALLQVDALSVAVASNQNGLLEMITCDGSGKLYRSRQTAVNAETWSDRVPFTGESGGVYGLAQNKNGELEFFYVGGNHDLYHNRQVGANSDVWTGETSFPGVQTIGLAVAQNADGHLEIFYVGMSNHLYHDWQTAPSSTSWAGMTPFEGASAVYLVPALNLDGRLELFYIGTGGRIYHDWQITPPGPVTDR